jgi:LCP family protein required for cell wall assembly
MVLVAALAVVLPAATVRPTTLSLSRVDTAKSIDFEDGVVWVLVLGSDARSGQPIEKGHTDAIQLLALDLESGAAAGIGIPRDAWVDLPGGRDRLGNAMIKGGTALTARAVENLVRVEPDFVLLTGFDGFLSMTEAVDGVDVVSSQRFVTDDAGFVVRRGLNHLDAEEALDFAATRDSLTSDFDRMANHQALLLGYLRGLRTREDEKGFMEDVTLAALGGLETDVAPTDLYRLAQAVTQVDPRKVTGCLVFGTPFTSSEEASVIDPDTGLARRLGRDAARDATLAPDCQG